MTVRRVQRVVQRVAENATLVHIYILPGAYVSALTYPHLHVTEAYARAREAFVVERFYFVRALVCYRSRIYKRNSPIDIGAKFEPLIVLFIKIPGGGRGGVDGELIIFTNFVRST